MANLNPSERAAIYFESYRNAHDLYKFFVSFRLKIVGFLATMNGALFYFWATNTTSSFFTRSIIATSGIMICVGLALLDRRNKELYIMCCDTAKSIETSALIKAKNSVYCMLQSEPTSVSHTWVIRFVAIAGTLFWFNLLIITNLSIILAVYTRLVVYLSLLVMST